MRITLPEIKTYTKCPKQYSFIKSTGISLSTENDPAVKTIIKQCYMNRSQHGYDPQWETIKGRINKYCFSSIDITNKNSFQEAYRQSIALMGVLHYWYYKVFLNDTRHGIVNIPLNVEVSNSVLIASVDIVLIDNKSGPVPIIFSNGKLPSELHNDIEFKTLLWMIGRETNMFPKSIEYATVSGTSVKYQTVFNRTPIDTIEKYVNFIVRGIENRVFFPSVGEQCNICTWKDSCTI